MGILYLVPLGPVAIIVREGGFVFLLRELVENWWVGVVVKLFLCMPLWWLSVVGCWVVVREVKHPE